MLTRRNFIRAAGVGVGATVLNQLTPAFGQGVAPSSAGRRRPNVLILMGDDLAFGDLGCYGSENATPHIDALAARGLRFTQFYGCSICSPSRAALLTGLYPHQAGMGWYGTDSRNGWPSGPYQGHLGGNCVTIAEVLKLAGYRTCLSGKWHLGDSRPHWPVDRGFDRYFGLLGGSANYFDLSKTDYPGVERPMALDDRFYHPPKEGFYMTDAIADHAVDFLNDPHRGESPFYLHVAFTAPHFPVQAPASDIARYRGRFRQGWDTLRADRHARMQRMGLVGSARLSPRDPDVPAWADAPDQDLQDAKMAVYSAQIAALDRGVGRILAKVRELGEEDNTLVLLLSDHGACAGEVCARREARFNRPPFLGGPDSYACYGRAWANLSNTPWRKFKTSLWEGGIAIPFIAACPGQIRPPDGLCHRVGHQMDVLPTILELTGVRCPRQFRGQVISPTEGASFAPALLGRREDAARPLFWELEGRRAMRAGDWKIVADHHGPWSLYDLANDRSELSDLAQVHPDRVGEMAGLHAAWSRRCGVQPWDEIRPRLPNRLEQLLQEELLREKTT